MSFFFQSWSPPLTEKGHASIQKKKKKKKKKRFIYIFIMYLGPKSELNSIKLSLWKIN